MKLGSNQIENYGDNYGVEAANNSGVIVVNNGLTYSDTKNICRDVINEELEKYKADAKIEAEKRSNELLDLVVGKLSIKQLEERTALSEFKNPAMQFDYLEAQKAYMKAGTPELAAVLSDILVRRVEEPSRTLLQIALGEAIRVAPKLIKSQMATLALAFNLLHTVSLTVDSHNSFSAYLNRTIIPLFNDGVSKKPSEFQHLNFTGCSQYSAFRNKLPEIFRRVYPGLFMKGQSPEKMPKDDNGNSFLDIYPKIFVKCLNNQSNWQIGAISKDAVSSLFKQENVLQQHQELLLKFFEDDKMSNEEIQHLIISIAPNMKEIFDYWDGSNISRLSLTSVGIIIGAQYSKLITGDEYNLSIWV